MKNRLTEIVDDILRSFADNKMNALHFDNSPLPEKEKIYNLIQNIFVVLFPGYFGHSEMSFESIDMRIGYRVARVYEDLKPQIHRELIHECLKQDDLCGQCEKAAEMLTFGFLESIPRLRKLLALDIQAAFKNDPAAVNFDEIVFSYPGFEAICVYRVAHFFYQNGLRLIPRIITEWAHSRTGVDIHPGATIGECFFIDHGTGVVIGETAQIGTGVTLYQGVTLGALNFPRDENGKIIRTAQRHPTIEDDVVIYAGATILGGKTVIGKNSIIGGNVWLTESIPANTKVMQKNSDLQMASRVNTPEYKNNRTL